jgi:cysteine desulfuration protein SufE
MTPRDPPPPDPLEALRAIGDAHERLTWLAERGRRAPMLDADERVPANRVPGCVSAVWLVDETRVGICRFRGDAEAPMLRGLVGLVCDRANGRAASDVAHDATDVVTALALERHLSPTRVQGLRALQSHVRVRAASHAPTTAP